MVYLPPEIIDKILWNGGKEIGFQLALVNKTTYFSVSNSDLFWRDQLLKEFTTVPKPSGFDALLATSRPFDLYNNEVWWSFVRQINRPNLRVIDKVYDPTINYLNVYKTLTTTPIKDLAELPLRELGSLIDAGFDITNTDVNEFSLFDYALMKEDEEMLELLIRNDYPVTIDDGEEFIGRDMLGSIGVMIERGLDINQYDSKGKTLLYYAILKDPDAVEYLLSLGADPSLPVSGRIFREGRYVNRKSYDLIELARDIAFYNDMYDETVALLEEAREQ